MELFGDCIVITLNSKLFCSEGKGICPSMLPVRQSNAKMRTC